MVSAMALSDDIESSRASPACQLPRRTQELSAAPKPRRSVTQARPLSSLLQRSCIYERNERMKGRSLVLIRHEHGLFFGRWAR